MATYVLIHGGGMDARAWHRVVPLLEADGHEAIAPDLPCADDAAGIEEYAETVVRAVADRSGIIVVAHSLGAYTAPLVATRVNTALVVLVAPMIPLAAETPGQWWTASGQEEARRALDEQEGRDPDEPADPAVLFWHDVPGDVVAVVTAGGEPAQSDTPFTRPWPLAAWPDVPTRVLLGRRDRLFPADLQRRLSRERLGLVPDEIDTGHVTPLADPEGLVRRLEAYRGSLTPASP